MDKAALLDKMRVSGDERLLLSQVLDRRRQAVKYAAPASTDFLSPHEQALASDLLRLAPASGTTYLFTGGPSDAERKILCFLPDWMSPGTLSPDEPAALPDAIADALPIRALRAQWRDADALSHRDLLGGLMGLGITRGKIGDIYTGDASADILALDSVTEFLLQNWTSAGRVRLSVTAIALDAVRVPPRQSVEIRDTVSSTRLDSVLSSGFRLPRSKAAELVRAGRVQVNWLDCDKPDKFLQPGDQISARGFGRFTLDRIGELTRKGRIPVFITRYL
ncbi:MAG: hypothetical protein IJQ81_14865 [Oscillibacter sp.]|nr:hypothetical protein [Oscillibacter sp.]